MVWNIRIIWEFFRSMNGGRWKYICSDDENDCIVSRYSNVGRLWLNCLEWPIENVISTFRAILWTSQVFAMDEERNILLFWLQECCTIVLSKVAQMLIYQIHLDEITEIDPQIWNHMSYIIYVIIFGHWRNKDFCFCFCFFFALF